jgi:glycerophosphoryl diester phosphodiesterase
MKLAHSEETIPTLAQVLEVVGGKVPLIIEYKMDRADTKVCELGNQVLQSYQGVYCIESFHPLAVQWYRKNRPDVMRGQLSENYARHGKKKLIIQDENMKN